MKNIILLILFTNSLYFSQIIISPYVVYMDEQEKYGSYIVQNESNEEYEITVSFVFGHPVSDSLGTVSMRYYDEPTDTLPSIVNWIRAFPKKFVLKPDQRQIIRMTVRPPSDLLNGTYWARIVTSSVPKTQAANTANSGISAKINFVLNQVTTVLFRKDPTTTGVKVNNFWSVADSTNLTLFTNLERTGNSPFWCNLKIILEDKLKNVVAEEEEYLPIYFDLVKKYSFSLSDIPSGPYTAKLILESNEKEDIPKSRLIPLPPVIKTIDIIIP
jgi:hypothetical protein